MDRAEVHHDPPVLDSQGKVLARKRPADSRGGVLELHKLVASYLDEGADVNYVVVVGIKVDRASLGWRSSKQSMKSAP